MNGTILRSCLLVGITACAVADAARADEYDDIVKPLLTKTCSGCHGEDEANAAIRFDQFPSSATFLRQPQLIQRTLEAVDSGAMPPESEPRLDAATRTQAVAVLRRLLREACLAAPKPRPQLQRLNRYQYNNTVRDLFQLNRNLFALPEKLMTRYDDYLQLGQMPPTVHVASHSLDPQPGLQDVKPFPKDLRAEHGFDNQTNQLTLSPLLLDSFLRLSVSIVESPDFNDQTVGIWNDFFQEPAEGTDRNAEVRSRLSRFLRMAFRGPVDDDTLNRYANYATASMDKGLSFTDGMKKVASAALSSPLFLYRSPAADARERQFELASRLSYFLWGSSPDEELLTLAERGDLSDPKVLDRTVTRMLADPKIERFLDAFPSQWMQLENLLAATPDPAINKYFSFDPEAPASLQMVLEPLLLFDATFVENRPLVELIAPPFSYRSDFLQTWYTGELRPTPIDNSQIIADNQRKNELRQTLQTSIQSTQAQLNALIDPLRQRLLAARREKNQTASLVDLNPFAAWEFDGDLTEPLHGLDLTAEGKIEFRDGLVVLNTAYLQSKPLPVDLKAKTLEVWCQLHNLDQRGGGLMGIQGPGDFFDTIVIGERMNRHWISGSNGFSRTKDFPDSTEETVTGETLHLVMVYAEDGTTMLYRNGVPYGKPYQKGSALFPKDQTTVLFGLRHLPAGGGKYLSVSLDRARLYDRALNAEEVAASAAGKSDFISNDALLAAMTPEQRTQREQWLSALEEATTKLKQVPENTDLAKATEAAQHRFESDLKKQLRSRAFRRIAADDPRYGGVITNAAMLSMTSGPKRTHPVARGVWVIEVIFNDPPQPPPNDVPPLDEETGAKDLTIREQFAAHRKNPSCAGCHTKLDPLGFALENFDITGRWRDMYDNGRQVDASGTLMRKHEFDSVTRFKASLVQEKRRFARAFTEHLLRFALGRELGLSDSLTVDAVLERTERDAFSMKSLIRHLILSESFFPPQ